MLRGYTTRVIRSLRYWIRFLTVTPTAFDDALADRPKGLQGLNRNYQKFIVFTNPRSGSSLMVGTLRKHPQIVGFGELFHGPSPGFGVEGYENCRDKFTILRNKYPVELLERYVFSSYRDDIRAVGFKLFPHHIDNDRFECLWQWLEGKREIKIIYLTRQNLLARYTSYLIARKDERFSIASESQRTRITITINPEECLVEFRKNMYFNEKIRKCLKHHEVIELTYEELAGDPHSRIKEVQQFLGVDVCDLDISLVKQEIRPLSDVIDNYDALRRYFAGTEWKYLFDG